MKCKMKGKIIVATGFEWLPKVQKIAESGGVSPILERPENLDVGVLGDHSPNRKKGCAITKIWTRFHFFSCWQFFILGKP